jgi:hypothetical protein
MVRVGVIANSSSEAGPDDGRDQLLQMKLYDPDALNATGSHLQGGRFAAPPLRCDPLTISASSDAFFG